MGRSVDADSRAFALDARQKNWTFAEIGEELGTSRQAAFQIHQRAAAAKALKKKARKKRRH